MESVPPFPDVQSIVRSIEQMHSPEERRFARSVGPVWRSLERIAEHEARLRARISGQPEPGAGVGDLPTPETTSVLSPLEPIPVSPVSPQDIRTTLEALNAQYVMSPADIDNIQWLMQTDLARAIDANAICQSLRLEPRAPM